MKFAAFFYFKKIPKICDKMKIKNKIVTDLWQNKIWK